MSFSTSKKHNNVVRSGGDDVIVIGGGVIGLACAYYLNRMGRQVRLLEAGQVAEGASNGNCGWLFFSDALPLCAPGVPTAEALRLIRGTSPLKLDPRPDPRRLLWLLRFVLSCRHAHLRAALKGKLALLRQADRLYAQLRTDEGLSGEYDCQGLLMVHRSAADMAAYAATNDLLAPYGLGADPLFANALQRLEPGLHPSLYGAWYYRNDSHLRPDTLMREWHRLALTKGVAVEEGVSVQRFRTHGNRVVGLQTNRGAYRAHAVVIAAGAWSLPLTHQLGYHLPLQPGKGYSLTFPAAAGQPAIPCYFHEPNVVATAWQSGFRLGGTMAFQGFDLTIDPQRVAHMESAGRAYLATPPAAGEGECWAGLRPMSADDMPLVGPLPGWANVTVATGHGMLGLTTAPSTGRLVAEMVTRRPLHLDPHPFRLDRFRLLRAEKQLVRPFFLDNSRQLLA
ncbi:MAG: FAD-dependent oxidoreductase [Desulfosarcinaceae bacterium]|nr:FAD-dependent oxidoreductase [Desulfosarcinaceae bacterium]